MELTIDHLDITPHDHNWVEITTYGDQQHTYLCNNWDCTATKTEAFQLVVASDGSSRA